MKMCDYDSMEKQSKFICVLHASILQLLSRVDREKSHSVIVQQDFPDPEADGGELKYVFSFPIEIRLS